MSQNNFTTNVPPENLLLQQKAKTDIPIGIGQSNDPWKHRSIRMSCATCMWYVAKNPSIGKELYNHKQVGRCRRHAPTINGYPAVFPSDWCGDHKIDENKI